MKLLAFGSCQPAFVDEPRKQRPRGAIEHAVHELLDHGGDDALLRNGRAVSIRTPLERLLEVPLAFERVHHRHHRRVGHPAPFAKGFVHLAHARVLEAPDDLHDGELLGAEGWCGSRHVDYYSYSTSTIVVNSERGRPL